MRCLLFSSQLTDYINASFMDGYKQRNAYIGTQGTALSCQGVILLLMHAWASPPCPASATGCRGGMTREEGTAWQVRLPAGCIYAPLGAFTPLPVPSWEGAEFLLQPPPTGRVLG